MYSFFFVIFVLAGIVLGSPWLVSNYVERLEAVSSGFYVSINSYNREGARIYFYNTSGETLDPTFSWGLTGNTRGRFQNIHGISTRNGTVYLYDSPILQSQSSDLRRWNSDTSSISRLQIFDPKESNQKLLLNTINFAVSVTPPSQKIKPRPSVNDDLFVGINQAAAELNVPPVITPSLVSVQMKVKNNALYFLDQAPVGRIAEFSLNLGVFTNEFARCSSNDLNGYQGYMKCDNLQKSLCNPIDFTIAFHGDFYVLDDVTTCLSSVALEERLHVNLLNTRVMVFDSTGRFLVQRQFKRGISDGAFADTLGGITSSLDGSIYLSDTGNDRVQIFNSTLHYKSQFGDAGIRPGQFNFPTLLSASSTHLFVLDLGQNQKQVQAVELLVRL